MKKLKSVVMTIIIFLNLFLQPDAGTTEKWTSLPLLREQL